MDLGKKKSLEVKRAVALQLKSGGQFALSGKVGLKRTSLSDEEHLLKRMIDPSGIGSL